VIIDTIELHHIDLPLVHPFETSFGRETTRPCILVAVHGGGVTGWGECVDGAGPWYSYETIGTAWHVLRDFLIPIVVGWEVASPLDVARHFRHVRGHPMARAALESAVWDLLARGQGVPLADLLVDPTARAERLSGGNGDFGRRQRVSVGVSLGIEPTLEALLDKVSHRIDEGYGRVKLKIKPGWDVDVVDAVRHRWPNLPLQVDANAAYGLSDASIIRELDRFDLLLIEQPFHHEDIVDHARLQAQLQTPLCLDESIHSPEHARWALEIDACRVINIKVGRVGGLTAAREIHDRCEERGLPVWCGGMLETNVGRAANVALASLPNFTLPGDISASARYYHRDIAEPDFVLNDDSTLSVPCDPGLGVCVDRERLAAVRKRHLVRRSE
jgi:O-succinylbenzoate synthase